ncbi:MAG: hypothetical protein ACK5P7_04050 [Bdellovibrio sp.]|jgi:hypothetical protein
MMTFVKRAGVLFVLSILAFVLVLSFSAESLAWGGRGHHTICEAASFLVQKKGLKDYLTSRPHMMGHLCNIPDFYWKSLGPDVGKLGNPTHFIDSELIGLKVIDIPTDYKKIIADYEGKPSKAKDGSAVFSIPTEFGSAWWRADQFFRRAIALGPAWKEAKIPSGFKEEQDENLAYNKSAYDFVVNLGLMGHFVGDMGQPFHGTLDYDGWGAGHGGIHAFYEDSGVAAQPYDLTTKVVEAAQKLQKAAASKVKTEQLKAQFLRPGSVVERMKLLTDSSFVEIQKIYAVDPIIKKSELKKEKGMDLKTPAERKPIDKTIAKKFEPLVVTQMARSAALLALLWDEAYEQVGEPKLAAYKSYKYPFTPDFVAPDYYDIPASAPKK